MGRTAAQLEEIQRGLERTGTGIEIAGRLVVGRLRAVEPRHPGTTGESLNSLKDALEMLNVSMEQGNALYRNIVKKLFDERAESAVVNGRSSIRVARARSMLVEDGRHGRAWATDV